VSARKGRRGYHGPTRRPRRRKQAPEPVLVLPEPPPARLSAREAGQQERITQEIAQARRRWAAQDRADAGHTNRRSR
jgi:hypothetical protein